MKKNILQRNICFFKIDSKYLQQYRNELKLLPSWFHEFPKFQSSEFSNVFWPIKLFEVWTNATTTNKQTRLDKIYVKIRNLKFVIPCGEQLKVSCFIFYKKKCSKKECEFFNNSKLYLPKGWFGVNCVRVRSLRLCWQTTDYGRPERK